MSRRQRTTGQYLAMCKRMIRAAGRRVSLEDPEQLAELAELAAEVDHALVVAVAGQRASGITWESIGEAFGMTRQGAIRRWNDRIEALHRAERWAQ